MTYEEKLAAALEQERRAFWEVRREDMTAWLIAEKKFNPKHVGKFVSSFIDSMVFAGLPERIGDAVPTVWGFLPVGPHPNQ